MGNQFVQDERPITINTPLGKDVLLLAGIRGAESISQLFSLELDLLSENNSISFEDIVGKPVLITVKRPKGDDRFFHGIISRFAQYTLKEAIAQRLSGYRATMVPWTWLLTRTSDSRIFQNLTVPEIIEKIFREKKFSDFNMAVQEQHDKRDYCVQYRETDFNFVSRLMEDEGIYFYFVHDKNKHTMMIADTPGKHNKLSRTVRYQRSFGGRLEEDVIAELDKAKVIQAGKYSLSDFNFEIPKTKLDSNVDSHEKLGPGEREIYDYPGGYSSNNSGDRLTRIRMEEKEAQITLITGAGDCRDFTSGYRFTLSYAFRRDITDQDYVLTSVAHSAVQRWEGEAVFTYSNRFTCIPYTTPFRPARVTAKPVVFGCQTATVVGQSGDEIYTDKYSRIKVQFHWDREGKRDENSSCWIRVAQPWASKAFGALFIPRVGDEVVVDFLEGDPDKPIVTGSVYNGANSPPYPLDAEKTKSTIKSNSSKGGGGFNELRFDDKKGSEQVFIHAEKQQDNRVKQDSLEWIGNERHLIVIKDQLEKVGGDKHLEVTKNQNEKIGGTVSLSAGGLEQKVGSKCAIDAGQEIHLKAGMSVIIEAGAQISLKVGGNYIDIGPAGVAIVGSTVLINSGGGAGSGSGASPGSPKPPKEAADK